MPIAAHPDHVAVAVPSIEGAAPRWIDQLGGGWVTPAFAGSGGSFGVRQARYAGGGKVELIEPRMADSFVAAYLARFGPGVHHVTCKVPALGPAVAVLEEAGLDVVDVSTEDEAWHEAFLRPSQVGGLIVQIAWARDDDVAWSATFGTTPEDPRPDAARLVGPRLAHPDLDAAARVWQLLGAEVERDGEVLNARWPGAPLEVEVVAGPRAQALGVRMSGTTPLPVDPDLGAAVLVDDPR